MEMCVHKMSHKDSQSASVPASNMEYWNPHLFHCVKLAQQTQNICSYWHRYGECKVWIKMTEPFCKPCMAQSVYICCLQKLCEGGGQNYSVLTSSI